MVPISYKYAFTNQILSTIGNTAIHPYVIEIAKGGKTIIPLTTKRKHKLGSCIPVLYLPATVTVFLKDLL